MKKRFETDCISFAVMTYSTYTWCKNAESSNTLKTNMLSAKIAKSFIFSEILVQATCIKMSDSDGSLDFEEKNESVVFQSKEKTDVMQTFGFSRVTFLFSVCAFTRICKAVMRYSVCTEWRSALPSFSA